MNAPRPVAKIKHWRSDKLLAVGFSSYSLTHHSFPRHFHDHYVIQLVVNGADRFYCSGNTYQAAANELVFINPGEVHTGSAVGGKTLVYYSMSPSIEQLQQIASILEKPLQNDLSFANQSSNRSRLANKMRSLFHAIEEDAQSLLSEELFLDFMNDLLDNGKGYDQTPKRCDERVQELINIMRESFTEPLSLQQMSEVTRISPFHLIRLFKASTGLSPYEYLLTLRVEHARKLLTKGRSVQDAALESGFYDTSHLNRMFKKVSGSSPKIFRSSK